MCCDKDKCCGQPEKPKDKPSEKQREALFGPPMDYGGLYGELLTVLDELIQLLLTNQPR